MRFTIFTQVEHFVADNVYFAYAPYVREMNVWLNYVDELLIIVPLDFKIRTAIHTSYKHHNIKLIPIPKMDLLRFKSNFKAIMHSPKLSWKILKVLRASDHIHLRCPGTIGLLTCLIQVLFPKKSKTAKYARNWDPKSKQPLSYQTQKWILTTANLTKNIKTLVNEGWKKIDSSRFVFCKRIGLDINTKPGFVPEFSHGLSISFLPPSGKIYEVEQLMGGVSSFRRDVFQSFQFSTYFEGYGLYEDADFTLRLSKAGKLYVNTAATLGHFHDSSGRPSQYRYGIMVVRNGWYVWRIKHRFPSFKAQVKWHSITLLLTFIRLTNTFTTDKKEDSFFEFLGRMVGWFSLLLNKPKLP
jgi:hypothetical protein